MRIKHVCVCGNKEIFIILFDVGSKMKWKLMTSCDGWKRNGKAKNIEVGMINEKENGIFMKEKLPVMIIFECEIDKLIHFNRKVYKIVRSE